MPLDEGKSKFPTATPVAPRLAGHVTFIPTWQENRYSLPSNFQRADTVFALAR